jgi:hypothetical protein
MISNKEVIEQSKKEVIELIGENKFRDATELLILMEVLRCKSEQK